MNNLKNQNPDDTMRLGKFLSMVGIASRRQAETLITAGEIIVNGQIVTIPATKVSSKDEIIYKNKSFKIKKRTYIMLNKPKGFLCSHSDPHADKTIYDLINIPGKRLFSVGRLDLQSEGLLLLTDDGNYAEQLTHPKYGVLKKYMVETTTPLSKKKRIQMCEGIFDDNELLKAVKIREIKNCRYEITLAEGKKREIRRMIISLKSKVKSLQRISIGALILGSLKEGKWRYLSYSDIKLSKE